MAFVVGLGNPGGEYQGTRHNVGYEVVDKIAEMHHFSTEKEFRGALVSRGRVGGQEVMLVKPQTFMNNSGRTAAALSARWEVKPQDVLVVFDDFLLDFGRLRFRRGGSDGGHNGLASVLEGLNTQDVPRLRMGIGSPPEGEEIIDYVLDSFSLEDEVGDLLERCEKALENYYAEGVEAAMNSFNGS